jgi:hypothetical protein
MLRSVTVFTVFKRHKEKAPDTPVIAGALARKIEIAGALKPAKRNAPAYRKEIRGVVLLTYSAVKKLN